MEAVNKNSATNWTTAKFRELCEISSFLNTGLTPEQLYSCSKLIKKGVNPEALAHCVKTVREEVRKIQPDE